MENEHLFFGYNKISGKFESIDPQMIENELKDNKIFSYVKNNNIYEVLEASKEAHQKL